MSRPLQRSLRISNAAGPFCVPRLLRYAGSTSSPAEPGEGPYRRTSIETPHDALLERRPKADANAGGAKRAAGPFVAGEDQRIAAVRLVEHVPVVIAASEHRDRAAAGVEP